MKEHLKFAVALCAIYMLLLGIGVALYLVLWTGISPMERRVVLDIFSSKIAPAVFILIIAMGIIGALLHAACTRYMTAPLRLRERLLVILGSHPEARLPMEGPSEFQALAASINDLAAQRDDLQRDIDARIRHANAAVEEEKNRFAALISELNQSVIVCNIDGRILLYNSHARTLFHKASKSEAVFMGGGMIGLGRSIFAAMDRNLITHALERIHYRITQGSTRPVTSFIATAPSGQLIRVQMAPVLNTFPSVSDEAPSLPLNDWTAQGLSGYVLLLDDITRSFETEGRRDAMLQSLTEGSRAALASIQAAVENLLHYPDMDAEQRDRFHRVMREEVCLMSKRIERVGIDYANELRVRWPLEEVRGSDLVRAAQNRIETHLSLLTKTEEIAEGIWIKVDSFSLMQALTYLAARLKEEFRVREVRFRLSRQGRLAHLDLIWSGVVIGTETLVGWELEPMRFDTEVSPLTLREVVERHGGEIWFQHDRPSHRSYFRIVIPVVDEPAVLLSESPQPDSRPEFYDFDLFRQTDESRAFDDRLLSELTYTAFDTETTGLNPSLGDEIIQIGAVRIVNGRLLKGEAFDQMVNPMRRVSADSVRIHGITEEMLRGQPTIAQVLPNFHAFCEDTVLVAHNAAFDMRFLQIKESVTDVQFRQPVLDTLLLSAVIHPNQELHTLEAIAARFGVNIIGRHTALGDAIVTGEVFLKMIPLLAEKDITTLRKARDAAERTYFAKVNY